MPEPKELVSISASRIGDFSRCSWIYFCKYVLKIADSPNSGSLRGGLCHSVLELLIHPKHKKRALKIIKSGSVFKDKVVGRYIKILAKKASLSEFDNKGEDNFKLIDEMILVALKTDFWGEGGVLQGAEEFFEYVDETETYRVRGFIDSQVSFETHYVITDYKTSKEPYTDDELAANLQALVYTMAKRRDVNKPIKVRFVFLRHPDNPVREVSFSDDQVEGFKSYLLEQAKFFQNFDFKKATSAMAYHKGYGVGFTGRTICGRAKFKGDLKKNGEIMWHCPLKFPFEYYAIVKDGKVEKSAFTIDELIKDADLTDKTIEKRQYKGCPAFN